MTRVALTGTIGAAVLVVGLGLFFAIYQQDQDDSGEAAPAPEQPTAPQADSDSTGGQGDATAPQPSQSAGTAGDAARPIIHQFRASPALIPAVKRSPAAE